MIEKRFRQGKSVLTDFPTDTIIDEKTGKRYYDGTKSSYIFANELVKILNEQHEKIHSLKIENDELRREVNLLTEFFRKNNFSLDDFDEWLTQEKWG